MTRGDTYKAMTNCEKRELLRKLKTRFHFWWSKEGGRLLVAVIVIVILLITSAGY